MRWYNLNTLNVVLVIQHFNVSRTFVALKIFFSIFLHGEQDFEIVVKISMTFVWSSKYFITLHSAFIFQVFQYDQIYIYNVVLTLVNARRLDIENKNVLLKLSNVVNINVISTLSIATLIRRCSLTKDVLE